MKKLAVNILILIASLVHVGFAFAQNQPVSNALRFDQRNPANTAYISRFVPPQATGSCIVTMNGADQSSTPICYPLGQSLSISGGAFSVSGNTGAQGPAGPQGVQGVQGVPGTNGTNGASGTNGVDGKSAYQQAVDAGFSGTVSAWLASLKGADGINGTNGVNGAPGTAGATGATGSTGATGAPGTTDYLQLTNRPALAPVATAGTYSSLTGIPATFAPSAHTHAWSEVTGKPTFATVATTGAYADLTGKPVIPTVPVINRVRATTAADGTYVWTYPTACSAAPVISVTPENTVSGEVINHKVTAVSATAMTVSVSRAVLTLNGLLGLTLPVIQTASAQVVHLIAICP